MNFTILNKTCKIFQMIGKVIILIVKFAAKLYEQILLKFTLYVFFCFISQ